MSILKSPMRAGTTHEPSNALFAVLDGFPFAGSVVFTRIAVASPPSHCIAFDSAHQVYLPTKNTTMAAPKHLLSLRPLNLTKEKQCRRAMIQRLSA
jgi:hypothetical protein